MTQEKINFSDNETALVQSAADKLGLTRADFIRRCVFHFLEEQGVIKQALSVAAPSDGRA